MLEIEGLEDGDGEGDGSRETLADALLECRELLEPLPTLGYDDGARFEPECE